MQKRDKHTHMHTADKMNEDEKSVCGKMGKTISNWNFGTEKYTTHAHANTNTNTSVHSVRVMQKDKYINIL